MLTKEQRHRCMSAIKGRNKIELNKLRDKEELRKLASIGWHCITVWECQLKPKVREQTLEALVYTLCHIFLNDRRIKPYADLHIPSYCFDTDSYKIRN